MKKLIPGTIIKTDNIFYMIISWPKTGIED